MMKNGALSRCEKLVSNHGDDHYCMNCLHSFRTEGKLKSRQQVCKNHDFCNIKMPVARNKILKFSQNHKSMKNLCHLQGRRMLALKITHM